MDPIEYVRAMGVLLTVTVFLEGFARVRSHRDIDEARQQGEQLDKLLTRPASDSPVGGRESQFAEQLFAGIGRARRTEQHARSLALAALLVSIMLFLLLCLHVLQAGMRLGLGLPDPRVVAALVLVVGQGTVTWLTRDDGKAAEDQLSQAEYTMIDSLLMTGEQELRPFNEPPKRAIVQRWNETLSVYLKNTDQRNNGRKQDVVSIEQSVDRKRDLTFWARSLRGRAALVEALTLMPHLAEPAGNGRDEQRGPEVEEERINMAWGLLRSARGDLCPVGGDHLVVHPMADVDTHYAWATALAASRRDPEWGGAEPEIVGALSSALGVQRLHGLYPARWFVPTDAKLWQKSVVDISASKDLEAMFLLRALIQLLAAVATEPEAAGRLVVPVAEAEQALHNVQRSLNENQPEPRFHVTVKVLRVALSSGCPFVEVWSSSRTEVRLPAALMLDLAIEFDLHPELDLNVKSWMSELYEAAPGEASLRLFRLPPNIRIADVLAAMVGTNDDVWERWLQTLEQRALGSIPEIARRLCRDAQLNRDARFPAPVLTWAVEALRKAQDEVNAQLLEARIANLPHPPDGHLAS